MNQIEIIDGIIWVAGFSGNTEELKNLDLSEKNIRINFVHPMLIINKTLTKMNLNSEIFCSSHYICSWFKRPR